MQKKLRTFFLMIATLLLLSGCGKEEVVEEVVTEPQIPAEAILPVMADENKGIKSTEIELSEFSFSIPEGYVYGKVDHENYSSYYVWQDKADKEYIFMNDSDIMLYIYDGLDENSPHADISEGEARVSLTNYIGYHTSTQDSRGISMDNQTTISYDDKNYIYCFKAYSGDYITTTYNAQCYPKTFYGVFALQKHTDTYNRRYCGFVFSNDGEGEFFKKSEYDFLFDQIKSSLKTNEFYTIQQSPMNYDPLLDTSGGRSYEQVIDMMANTYLYYVETIGKPWERENVDPEPVDTGVIDYESADFSIRFMDVGHGDATLVQCDDSYLMIDGGCPADAEKINSILEENKIEKLDMVIASHLKENHMGGLSEILSNTGSELTLSPVSELENELFAELKKSADENGGGITVPSAGDTFSLGSAEIKILAVHTGSAENDACIVFRITYGNNSFLFMADAGYEVEKSIFESETDLTTDVLKVGNHGSETSTSYLFMQKVNPKHGVISVGKDNDYGYPAETILRLLVDKEVSVWRTDLLGDIYCVSDGEKVTFLNEILTENEEVSPVSDAETTDDL